ncbi:MAG: hydroxymethylbilane synthase [Acetobacteraceae bacterium]|jgi:hydroxymethylbilane synthase
MTTAMQPPLRPHDRAPALRVGTRGSPLALIQTRLFIELLRPACSRVLEEHPIRTTGDAVQNRRLAEIGGKGLFAKEIHEALADRRIDFAVHSLKDLETTLPPGIVLACTLARDDARDSLILGAADAPVDPADPFACLPLGALVGTASVRRQAQLLHVRPDLSITTLRGNVQTRLDKLAAGACAASLLAYAGLKRLGMAERASVVLDPDAMVPAVGQGTIGVTVREADTELRELLAAIEDPGAKAASTAERAMLARLDGSCRTPIGGYAQVRPDGELHLTGLVARSDGLFLLKRSLHGPVSDADRIGSELGDSLRADSPSDLFA